jgi:putative salt-induced outer membrane protein YdiY
MNEPLTMFRPHSERASSPAAACLTLALVLVMSPAVQASSTERAIADQVPSANSVAVEPPKSPLPDLSWVPPDDGFDWIQIKSGEWLKGSIKAMQERKLEFDSEELKLLTFDWKDIRQVRSPRENEMLFEQAGRVTGTVAITPEQVTVGGTPPRTFARSELESITPTGSRERNHWSGSLSLGLALHTGNTKSVDYNGKASLQRRTATTRLRLDYIGNISSVDDVESANKQRVNTEFDYWLSGRLYLILPQAEYFSDTFQNINHRDTLGGGFGYSLVDRPALEWNVSAGLGYQRTWFQSVETGEPPVTNQAAITTGSKFDWEITQRLDLGLEYMVNSPGKRPAKTPITR